MCRGESANDNTRPGAVFVLHAADTATGVYTARVTNPFISGPIPGARTHTHEHVVVDIIHE